MKIKDQKVKEIKSRVQIKKILIIKSGSELENK